MNSSDPTMDRVADLLGGGRTVAFKTDLAHATGSVTAGLLLSQFWYWSNSRDVTDREGWFWKTMPEIQEETGLTRTEQENARRRLVQAGVLEEERRGVPARLWFRVDKAGLYRLLSDYLTNKDAGNLHSCLQVSCKLDAAKPANKNAANPHAIRGTEITAEITSQTTTAEAARQTPRTPCTPRRSAAAEETPPEEAKKVAPDSALVTALAEAGLNRADARRLAREQPDECRRQLAFLPYVGEFRSSRGAYLRTAIEQGFAPPPGWQAAQEQEEKAAKAARRRQAQAAKAAAEQAARARRKAAREALQAHQPALFAELVRQAEAQLPPPVRNRPDGPAYRAALEGRLDALVAALETADTPASA